jgi:hypothetical protein
LRGRGGCCGGLCGRYFPNHPPPTPLTFHTTKGFQIPQSPHFRLSITQQYPSQEWCGYMVWLDWSYKCYRSRGVTSVVCKSIFLD